MRAKIDLLSRQRERRVLLNRPSKACFVVELIAFVLSPVVLCDDRINTAVFDSHTRRKSLCQAYSLRRLRSASSIVNVAGGHSETSSHIGTVEQLTTCC